MSLRPYLNENGIEIGLDEVGRGCLAGPVVTAAVILPKDFNYSIVKDSKKLSEKKRKEAYKLIVDNAISYTVSFIHPQDVDSLNILQATMKGMHECLDSMIKFNGKEFDHILVDGNYFKQYKEIPHTCIIKGDNTYYSIAAASILAKVSRDEYMIELHNEFPEYGWGSNKGYGTKYHIDMIRTYGETQYHRKSFLKNIL